MRSALLVFMILVFALLSGCSRSQEEEITATTPTEHKLMTEEPEVEETEIEGPGYPAAPIYPTVPPPYPASDPSPDPTSVIIDPQTIMENLNPGLGAVTGIILDKKQPRPNAIIYLAEVISDEQGREMVASYDRSSSPRSETDAMGRFVFINIPPGRYGLILDTVVSAYLLHFPNEDLPFLFTVVADELEDIGELDYDNLPLP